MADELRTRRDVLRAGLSVAAGLAAFTAPGFVFPGELDDEELVPFLDTPRTPEHRLDWEMLEEWFTPQDQVFNVQHYGIPEIDPETYALELKGLFEKPQKLTIDEIRALPREDRVMTLECSGNGSSKGFMNAVYNSRWTGTPLRALLERAGLQKNAKEIVFFGLDTKEETLRKDTDRELTFQAEFGRSLSVEDALGRDCILAYERNGEPIEERNGAPLRLIVPGWYGIANVKWLGRIEARDRRYMGRYMARDYVTVRGERRGGEVVWLETSVGPMNLKSVVARVTRRATKDGKVPLRALGAAWSDGTPIERVEVRLDDGDWVAAELAKEPHAKHAWRFFSIDLGTVAPGKHTLVSRAIDAEGRVQPTSEDDEIALKRTYWEAYAQWPREVEVEA